MNISIINGRLIDPANNIDKISGIHVHSREIAAIGAPPADYEATIVIDAKDKIVCPGFVDIAAALREPGDENTATIASETIAAKVSGITTLICPPNTHPCIDTPAVVELIHRKARKLKNARVLTVGALTKGLEGELLSEMHALKEAGCVAIGNSRKPLASTLVERRALEYAATFDLTVFLRSEDRHLRDNGCAHEGAVAMLMGLPGIPSAAETVATARDLVLAEHTGAKVHFRGLSTAGAAKMIGEARANKQQVSADVAAHQLHLTEMDISNFDARCKVSPPLRTLADRDALRRAVADGTIQAITSDHQPQNQDAKEAPFPAASNGISGLESLLGLVLKLVDEGVMDLSTALARITCGPADILDLPYGRLSVGSPADICVFDLDDYQMLNAKKMLSNGKNTPFDGWELPGRVTQTIFNGRVVYNSEATE